MKLSDYVAKLLKSIGVEYVFGYQGGSITHLIESFDSVGINYIQNYNEQGSAFAADAYSRVCNKGIGVAIASNGPGATNLITGIADAYCDSVPVLYITGQVHTWGMKKNAEIRQESFQEIDIISMVKPITKYAVTIMKAMDIKYEIEKAVSIAMEGRKGPVLIDIPVDIQGTDIDENKLEGYVVDDNSYSDIDEQQFDKVIESLENSRRPVILVGGGVSSHEAKLALRKFVEKNSIPVVSSLQGLDVINHDNKSFIGFIGTYGNRYANIALQNADLILVLGSRLDMRQIGKDKESFAQDAQVIHIDIDKTELKHKIKNEIPIYGDVYSFIFNLGKAKQIYLDYSNWLNLINNWKERYKEYQKANVIVEVLSKMLSDNTVAIADVGQNQMWVAQSLRIIGNNIRIINSGGLGAMGYALPAVIGAYYANKNNNIIAFMGDGGLQMNIQELCVIGSRKLPIKIFVFNNKSLGLIRDIHEKYYNSNYVGSVEGFSQPNLESLSKAYDISYVRIENLDDLHKIAERLEDKSPILYDIILDNKTYVEPELLGMDSLDNQKPYLTEFEINKIKMELQEL